MLTWLIVLFVLSGVLALGALGQLVASWRVDVSKPSASGAVALLGARMCLGCWSVVLLLKCLGWALSGLSDPLPLPLQALFGIPFYAATIVSVAGVVISTIGATAWLIRS